MLRSMFKLGSSIVQTYASANLRECELTRVRTHTSANLGGRLVLIKQFYIYI